MFITVSQTFIIDLKIINVAMTVLAKYDDILTLW
jgi:hypothetical protein